MPYRPSLSVAEFWDHHPRTGKRGPTQRQFGPDASPRPTGKPWLKRGGNRRAKVGIRDAILPLVDTSIG